LFVQSDLRFYIVLVNNYFDHICFSLSECIRYCLSNHNFNLANQNVPGIVYQIITLINLVVANQNYMFIQSKLESLLFQPTRMHLVIPNKT